MEEKKQQYDDVEFEVVEADGPVKNSPPPLPGAGYQPKYSDRRSQSLPPFCTPSALLFVLANPVASF